MRTYVLFLEKIQQGVKEEEVKLEDIKEEKQERHPVEDLEVSRESLIVRQLKEELEEKDALIRDVVGKSTTLIIEEKKKEILDELNKFKVELENKFTERMNQEVH